MGLKIGMWNKKQVDTTPLLFCPLFLWSLYLLAIPPPILNTLCSDLHLSLFPPALLAYLHGADAGEPLYGIMVAFLRNQREQTGFWD